MSEWIDVSFEAEGVRLYAVEAGRGAPVILLHGGLANHLACRAHAAPLVGSHRVITPDLRGSGRSHYAGELGWDQLADDIAAIVRQLGASRVAIGGVSFGSGVATAFALRHPSMVDRLMLVWPVYAGSDVGLMPAQREALETCLEKLPADQRAMVNSAYSPGARIDHLATRTGRTAMAFYKSLHRIRLALIQCTRQILMKEGLS